MSKHRTHRIWWDRLLSGVLCLALTLGLLPTAGLGLVQTADAASWADPYGEQLVEWGIMMPSSDLRLGRTTTRAEFIAMCNRAFGFHVLGDMPFTDVPRTAWYAEDINIAYNAGYIEGTTPRTASPLSILTRQEAAVVLARCLRLQETVGESLAFTDSREISSWASGLIGALAAENIIDGLPDGSFAPKNTITRGEVAAMLVRALGTPISKPGSYDEVGGGTVYGNVTITSSDVTLRDTVIDGNLYITGGVDLGNVLLENVTVFGRIIISGGGESHEGRSSVVLRNVQADELTVDSMTNQFVTISAYGLTDIYNTYVRSNAFLEDSCTDGHGLHYIEQDGAKLLQLAGRIKEVVNKTPLSLLQLVSGTAKKITIDEYATGSELLIDVYTVVEELRLDVATRVYGKGDIIDLVIGANGCEVEILPERVDIRPGLTAALVDEEGNERTIGSTDADELSSEPRILSGYPSVSRNLRPTTAEGLFAGNKPGTIYWAVSARADGSVNPKDLINNPPYGGNILKDGEVLQAGSIDAIARTEFARQITGLEPDGSYYISAILVDERNNQSPLKVFAFTTPDDTVPEFLEGYPYMSKTTCDVAQVTAMANKSCTLHWVLLTHGATAPTEQSFKTGSFGGNYGTGTVDMVKNVPVSIQVNSSRLQEKTDYDLYLWLTDGTLSSAVVKVVNEETQRPEDPSFSTPDQTPPSVSNVRQTNANLDDAIEFAFTINEEATLYWAVVTATDTNFIRDTDDPNSLRIQTKVQNGTGAIKHGSMEAAGAGEETIVGAAAFENALKYSVYGTHNFRLYYVAKDAAGNYSEVRSILVYTRDNEKPTVSISFSAAKYSTPEDQAANRNPRPLADTSITLIFSESVKGYGNDAKSFVELYNEVDRCVKQGISETPQDIADGDETNNPLTKAKNKLGEELAKCIELYYEPDSRSDPIKMGPEGTVSGDEEFGWLNLREATVKLNTDDGTLELTLPSGKAVKLGGGMSYHFQFRDIHDDSYTANPLVVMRDGKENRDGIMDSFTTVFAQVWMKFLEDDVVEVDGKDFRMDILVDIDPDAMSSTAKAAYWDMIMWCDTLVDFELYRKVGDGDNSKWEKMGTYSWNTSTSTGITWSRRDGDPVPGLIGAFEVEGMDPNEGLDPETTYHYGIHFTSINDVAETPADIEAAKAPASWGDKVTMWFSIIAGNSANVRRSVSENFNADRTLKADSRVNEIGTDYENITESKLETYRQFTDTTPPTFYSNYPVFTPASSSVIMQVATKDSRTGKLYYVAAPVEAGTPSIVTVNGAGKEINGTTDSKTNKDNKDADDYMTYIPDGGATRYTNRDYIYYYDAVYNNNAEKRTQENTTPIPGFITAPATRYGSIPNAVWDGPIEIGGGAVQQITISGLKPATKYYIYIVLQGNGDDSVSKVVEIYQFTTKPAYPPAIIMSHYDEPVTNPTDKTTSTHVGVSMTITESDGSKKYESPVLNYALLRKDQLPSLLTDPFEARLKENSGFTRPSGYDPYTPPTDGQGGESQGGNSSKNYMTVLDALLTRSGNQTYFDLYAKDDLKDEVMQYITQATGADKWGVWVKYYDEVGMDQLAESNPWKQDCTDQLTTAGEYVMLACARNYYEEDASHGKNYGFAAARGLYKPDDVPPELTVPAVTDGTGSITANITGHWRPNGTGGTKWTKGYPDDLLGNEAAPALRWDYSGSIGITFDKAIYVYDKGVLKQVVAPTEQEDGEFDVDDPETEISILKWIGGTAEFASATGNSDNTAFTLTFNKMRTGQYFTLGNLYNSSGSEAGKSPNTLVVTFETRLEGYEWANADFRQVEAYFNVTWKASK